MSWLAPIPDDWVMPASMAPLVARAVVEPTVTASAAARVPVRECGEPLVELPRDVARAVLYDDLPLPTRRTTLVREGVVARLRAARAALPAGVDLVVLDGWRSLAFQTALREHYLSTQGEVSTEYVAAADDEALRAGHTTGGAVDVTLSWQGTPLALGTDYDAFTALAHPAAFEREGADESVRDLRRLLVAVMTDAGFAPYPVEWWHFSWGEQWWAAVTGSPQAIYDVTSPAGEPLDDRRD
jgi:D-alanyl-D-alanine dipeptidase